MKHELSEEELLSLVKRLRKLDEDLGGGSSDSMALQELIKYVENRLKVIAWRKYEREHQIP